MTERPDWLTPGTKVAELKSHTGSDTVTFTTIERVLKRDVVLANGERYNADKLRRYSGGAWGPTYYLHPADDPLVVKVFAEQSLERGVSAAENELQRWRRTQRHERTSEPLRKALEALRLALSLDELRTKAEFVLAEDLEVPSGG